MIKTAPLINEAYKILGIECKLCRSIVIFLDKFDPVYFGLNVAIKITLNSSNSTQYASNHASDSKGCFTHTRSFSLFPSSLYIVTPFIAL